MTSIRSLTRLTAFRLAALFAGLFALAIFAILTLLYVVISNNLQDRIKTHVDTQRATIIDLDKNSTFNDLAKLVGSYAADAEPEEDIFLLTDTTNAYVAGNILTLPTFANVTFISGLAIILQFNRCEKLFPRS